MYLQLTSCRPIASLSRERRAGLRPRTETLHRTCYSQVYASASFIRALSRCISLPLVLLYIANERRTREARRCSESAINRSRALDNPGLINLTISQSFSRVVALAIVGDRKSTRKYFNMDFCEIIYILLFMSPKQTRIFDAHNDEW